MAITAATKTTDFSGFIPAEIASPIFERAAQVSVVQQLVPQEPLGFQGKSVPVVTGRPVANWVDEGGRKPATKGTMDLKSLVPKKLASIVVTSAEVVRANPGGYITNLRSQLAEAFGIAFDYAALYDLGGDGTGTGPFSTFIAQTTKSVELGQNNQAAGGLLTDLADAMQEVIDDRDASGRRYKVTGVALDSIVEMRFRRAVDSTGQPIWVDLPRDITAPGLARAGNLLGRPSFMGDGVADPNEHNLGFVGDFSLARWGVVGGINYDVSDQATVTIDGSLVSLWENNLVAVRAEAEYGFLVSDVDGFCALRNDTGS